MPVPAGLLQAGLSEIAESANGPFALLLRRLGSGGVGPPGPPGPPGPSAASVANVAALAALPTAGFLPGTIVLVQSMWDFWNYDPFDVTSVPDGITIVPAFGGGFWHRMQIADQLWIHQTSWFIDSVAGNDENDGATALTALQTHPEYNRRVGGPERTLIVGAPSIVITIIGSVPNVVADIVSLGTATITYVGVLPAPTASAIAAVTLPDPTTQTGLTVTLTGAWGGQKLVHDTTADTWFWGYDDVGPLAQATAPGAAPFLPLPAPGANPAPLDVVNLYDYATMAVLSSFQLSARSSVVLQPAVIVTRLRMGNGHVINDVDMDRCLLDPGVDIRGVAVVAAVCADLFIANGTHQWIEAEFVTGGCFFDTVQHINGLQFVAFANNYILLGLQNAELLSNIDTRFVSSVTRPANAQLGVDMGSTSSGVIWGTAGSQILVDHNSIVSLPGATTASFNFTTVTIGGGPPIFPPFLPGLVVPATALCTTTPELFGAPFFGNAFEVVRGGRIVQG